jgi:hypothetical protein
MQGEAHGSPWEHEREKYSEDQTNVGSWAFPFYCLIALVVGSSFTGPALDCSRLSGRFGCEDVESLRIKFDVVPRLALHFRF